MKIFIFLMATICSCKATFFNFGGGGGGRSHNAIPTMSYKSAHGHSGPPQIIKVILLQGNSNAGAYSHASSSNYGGGGGGGGGFGGETQIYKVISQSSAGPAPAHVNHGYSAASSQGLSYASGYGQSDSNSYNSQLYAILPQIIQLILEGDDDLGVGKYNSQLVGHYGTNGKALVTRSNGKNNDYYSSGHVVEKGVLKIMQINEAPRHGQQEHGYSSHGPSSHGPPSHGPPSHGHGW